MISVTSDNTSSARLPRGPLPQLPSPRIPFLPKIVDFNAECFFGGDSASAAYGTLGGKKVIVLSGSLEASAEAVVGNLFSLQFFRRIDALIQGDCSSTEAEFLVTVEFIDPQGMSDAAVFDCPAILAQTLPNCISRLRITTDSVDSTGSSIPLGSAETAITFQNNVQDPGGGGTIHTFSVIGALVTGLRGESNPVFFDPNVSPSSCSI